MPLFLFAYQLLVVPPQQLFVLGAHFKRSGRFGKDEPIHHPASLWTVTVDSRASSYGPS